METFGKNLGLKIKSARERSGHSIVGLARLAFDDESKARRISEIESGEIASPNAKTFGPLVAFLGITDEEIKACKPKENSRKKLVPAPDRTDSDNKNPSHDSRIKPSQDDFPFQSFGKIELPVTTIFADPHQPYSIGDFEIHFRDEVFHKSPRFPAELMATLPILEDMYKKRTVGSENLEANLLPRLDRFAQAGENQQDERGNIILYLSKTDYLHYCATNRSLEALAFPENNKLVSIRDRLAPSPLNLCDSLLGNTISTHTAVISKSESQSPKEKLIILRRSQSSTIFPGHFQSAAGYVSLAHVDDAGLPNPFITAVEESKTEIADDLDIDKNRVHMTALGMSWEDLDLNFCSYCVTPQSSDFLMNSFRRDGYEGQRFSISWDPKTVLNHIVDNKWEPIGAYNVCMALVACFGREAILTAAKNAGAKAWYEFLEHSGR